MLLISEQTVDDLKASPPPPARDLANRHFKHSV